MGKIAIFGVGDSAGYGDNFCDATGELYDCFTAKGAKIFGMTPSDEGFDYVESKGVKDGKFVGKTFDEDNYADDSEGRVDAWIEQLKGEGFMELVSPSRCCQVVSFRLARSSCYEICLRQVKRLALQVSLVALAAFLSIFHRQERGWPFSSLSFCGA